MFIIKMSMADFQSFDSFARSFGDKWGGLSTLNLTGSKVNKMCFLWPAALLRLGIYFS